MHLTSELKKNVTIAECSNEARFITYRAVLSIPYLYNCREPHLKQSPRRQLLLQRLLIPSLTNPRTYLELLKPSLSTLKHQWQLCATALYSPSPTRGPGHTKSNPKDGSTTP